MSERKQLLIVEDDEETAIFLSRVLEDGGFDYQVARDGVEAISAVSKERPELVLLDIMMPRKSGIQVFREMKSDPELEDIPVIMVTGISQITGTDLRTGNQEPKQDEGDVVAHQFGSVFREKIKRLKPDALIEKPIDPDLLIGQIQSLLS